MLRKCIFLPYGTLSGRKARCEKRIRSVAYLSILAWLLVGVAGTQSQDLLPSSNKGAARQAILNFVYTTT